MKVLGLDSSGLVAGVALIQDDVLIAEYTTDYKKTHSQTLLPMLDELRRMVDLDLKSIDLIAVAAGPGSFTGLRIGSATAKGLGLALDIPLAAVPTVDALAYNLYGCEQLICPMMDARRSQVYTAGFSWEQGRLTRLLPDCAISIEELGDALKKCEKPKILVGDGATLCYNTLGSFLTDLTLAPEHLRLQRASGVALAALEQIKGGAVPSAAQLTPNYLRLSQAERERVEREAKAQKGEY